MRLKRIFCATEFCMDHAPWARGKAGRFFTYKYSSHNQANRFEKTLRYKDGIKCCSTDYYHNHQHSAK